MEKYCWLSGRNSALAEDWIRRESGNIFRTFQKCRNSALAEDWIRSCSVVWCNLNAEGRNSALAEDWIRRKRAGLEGC